MRVRAAMVAAAWLVGCGSKEPPRVLAPTPVATATPEVDEATRPLSQAECRSLAQWMVGACEDRGNDRSTQVDGWCSDLVRRTAGGDDDAWVTDDCIPHIKYIDAACFRSTTIVRAMMDCDRNVDRSR